LDDEATSILIDRQGKILIGGKFSSYNGHSAKYLVRLNPDGTWDSTFDSSNLLDGPVYSISSDSGGYAALAGNFVSYTAERVDFFVRITESGEPLIHSPL
ncbi:MAG: delta-60 repeat domain-containing protein, partial [Bdellovibrionota bacterium]